LKVLKKQIKYREMAILNRGKRGAEREMEKGKAAFSALLNEVYFVVKKSNLKYNLYN